MIEENQYRSEKLFIEGEAMLEKVKEFDIEQAFHDLMKKEIGPSGECAATGGHWTLRAAFFNTHVDPTGHYGHLHFQSKGKRPDGEDGIYEMWVQFRVG